MSRDEHQTRHKPKVEINYILDIRPTRFPSIKPNQIHLTLTGTRSKWPSKSILVNLEKQPGLARHTQPCE